MSNERTKGNIEDLVPFISELHNSLRERESLENKLAFGFSAVILGFAAYVVKRDVSLELPGQVFATCIVLAACCVGYETLRKSTALTKMTCKMLVRVEQVYGLYRSEYYISKEDLQQFEGIPFDEPTVFPMEARSWGSGKWQTFFGHSGALFLSAAAAIVAVWLF